MKWVAFPFSRVSSQPRDWTWISHTAGKFFTISATRVSPLQGEELLVPYLLNISYLPVGKARNIVIQLEKQDITNPEFYEVLIIYLIIHFIYSSNNIVSKIETSEKIGEMILFIYGLQHLKKKTNRV